MSTVDEMFAQIDQQLLNSIKSLILKGIEWRRREIDFIAGVVQRMASRADEAAKELDFEIVRIWSNKVVARRWGRTLPQVDRPMIRLEWPGKYDPSYYDEVIMLSSPYGTNVEVKIPRMPFHDIMHTDPRLRWADSDLIIGQISGVRIVAKSSLDIDYMYGCGGTVTAMDFFGKTSIMIRPVSWLVTRPWSDSACVCGPSSQICFKPKSAIMMYNGVMYDINVSEVKSVAMNAVMAEVSIGGQPYHIHSYLGVATAKGSISATFQSGTASFYDGAVSVVCAYVVCPIDIDAVEIVLRDTTVPLAPAVKGAQGLVYSKCVVMYKQGARRAVIPVEAQISS